MRTHKQKRSGFTLVEMLIVVVILGVVSAIAAPSLGVFVSRQNLRTSARAAADAFVLARSEAMRSGVNHVVFMSIGAPPGDGDPRGTTIADGAGNPVNMLILQDDDGDCSIDPNEPFRFLNFQPNVTWGVTNANTKAPLDDPAGSGPPVGNINFGSTFGNPASPAVVRRWIFFGPDGVPLGFEGNAGTGCGTLGVVGSGDGGIYITDGDRDYAVVLTTLGGTRMHAWDSSAGAWTL